MDELEWFSIGIRMIFLLLFVGIPPIKSGRWGCWLEEFEPRIPRIAV